MTHIHFFHRLEQPLPGSTAKPVRYPVCEWHPTEHPMNRFVCSWLSSDVSDVSRCDEVLQAVTEIENHTRTEWFADGAMFCVDFKTHGVQFNQSNVGPEDTAWWNLPEGRFSLADVKDVVRAWRNFLAQDAKR